MTTTNDLYAAREFEGMPIGGQWRAGSVGRAKVDTDPYHGDTLVEIPLADSNDVDEAYRLARDAQRDWARRTPQQRAEVMRRAAQVMTDLSDHIIDWLVREAGSTVAKARAEWLATRNDFLEAASYPHRMSGALLPADVPGKESRVYRRPLGVVGVISPWNWPMHLSNRSVAPALAVGNAVVLKPAGDTPVTGGLLLAHVLREAGLPESLLSVIVGSGGTVGDAMVQHPIPRMVSFTGSTEVGVGIRQKAGTKKVAMELGGNGPLVVLDDADLEYATEAALFGTFFHQGQICIRTNRIIVDDAVHDAFVDRFLARTRELQYGDPAKPDTDIGPVINASQLESIQDKLVRGRDAGAEVLLAGDPTGPTGLVLPPHVVLANNSAPPAAEEVFGPVGTVIRARGEENARDIANDTNYGLASAVFTTDVERGARFAAGIEAGMTHINDQTVNDEANTAFGGEKDSGVGRFGGEWAIEEFTTDHWVSIQHEKRTFPFQRKGSTTPSAGV
ncbi:aldehyde dehydrogenase (NAD+) [Lipingzhangella halophila]|uniref:Aldehyde dehydrogenase (NAD+) n=1 Tax=Lipingzhangella halophila TaxID=1783352 RepID=A0A7W7RNL2_9ACTN|nr:aldehyde dehydrogenase family protein [Lipingzhangella halophila]MBB4935284.1 aldehyde dehydrogenase (NAD+) [Lipingzhangella halophila]